jgi:inner membrane transporter RhtA
MVRVFLLKSAETGLYLTWGWYRQAMSSSHRFHSVLPMLAVLGSVVALTLGTSYAKQLFPVVGSMGTTALRVGFSALLLLLVWRPWRWPLAPADRMAMLRFGVALGLMNLCFYMALRTIPFGVAVAIEFSGPLAVALFGSRRPVDYVWLVFSMLGLGLLLPLSGTAQALDVTGVLYALAAAALWAAYIVFGKRLGHLHAGHSAALGLTVAAITVVPFGVWHAGAALLEPSTLLMGLVVAVVSSAIPYSLEMVALKRLPQGTFGILLSMEPAVAALMGLLLLHEHLSLQQWGAILFIMVAAAGSSVTAARREPTQAPEAPVAKS